ncbi:MAG: HAMP domain-containing histidine kinase [Candidatus Latescibacteria bacterium]|nr:HAMP domain-containing histidine kinase [Candidatus Latescibacterota bacterium]
MNLPIFPNTKYLDDSAIDSSGTEDLLAQREARALHWTCSVRIVFVALSMVMLSPATDEFSELYAYLNLFTLHLITQVVIIVKLRKPHNVFALGLTGVISDIALLSVLPVVWHLVYTGEGQPIIHLTQHNLTAACLTFIALNGLALRPLYPALITLVAVALHVVLAWLGINDPNLALYEGGLDRAIGEGRDAIDTLYVTPFLVAIAGCLVTHAVRASRTTVREAVSREQLEHNLREQHLKAIMGARLDAVGNIVAGLQHEVNSPLGAMSSAADTARKAIDHFRGNMEQETRLAQQDERALSVAGNALSLIDQTSQRLADVMATLRNFVQLDRAEMQRIDLGEILESVLERQRPSFREDTEVKSETDHGLLVMGDSRQLMEALITLVRNAGEAFDGPGEIKISLQGASKKAILHIQDTGRGMPPEQVEQLFEVDFNSGTRIYARFGLPLCRSILHGYGGDIEVKSKTGEGTTVTIQLPLVDA